MIKNIINGRFYIGSTVDIDTRWRRHKVDLKNNNHHSILLQRSWNKYGEQSFRFKKLIVCSKRLLLQKEQEFIDKLQPTLNILQIAGSCLGYNPTKEHRQKIRIANKLYFENNPDKLEKLLSYSRKAVVQINKTTGKVIRTFRSCADAARFMKVPHATINGCLLGKCKSSSGFKWKYV